MAAQINATAVSALARVNGAAGFTGSSKPRRARAVHPFVHVGRRGVSPRVARRNCYHLPQITGNSQGEISFGTCGAGWHALKERALTALPSCPVVKWYHRGLWILFSWFESMRGSEYLQGK